MTVRPLCTKNGSANTETETFRELLRTFIHPLRAIESFSEHPLVLRQAQLDRLKIAMVQWHGLAGNILRVQTSLGNVPVDYGVPRCVADSTHGYD